MLKPLFYKTLRILVFPLAILYGIVVYFRNLFFDLGIYSSNKFDVPVIAVGNLSVGGTGKSPQIEYLIKLLKATHKVAVLSRGYKRKSEGFLLANPKTTVNDIGDEPFQFYSKYPQAMVAVDADRTHGIKTLLQKESKLDVILLDDAFQHRKVKASFYVLLTSYGKLYANDYLVPSGTLRESRKGAKRAQIIIVTKCPVNLSNSEQEVILNKLNPTKKQAVFFTSIKYANRIISDTNELVISKLADYEVLLLTGIANPNPLLEHLKQLQVNYKHLKFPDHYNFSEKDLSKINNEFIKLTSTKKLILTTEKDYMRLQGRIANLYYLGIETNFLNNQSTVFNELVLQETKGVKTL
ncbi:tetraacyldisaccharide 4'-kinase [Bacteroidota bacterium]